MTIPIEVRAESDDYPYTGSIPERTGPEYNQLFTESLESLPGLRKVSSSRLYIFGTSQDDLIYEVQFDRGYRIRPEADRSRLVGSGTRAMQPELAEAWLALRAEASRQGWSLSFTSAFRAVDVQRSIAQRRYRHADTWSEVNAVARWHSVPGTSKHHTGYTLDIGYAGGKLQAYSAPYKWLAADNYALAKSYGFIPSYPPDGGKQGPNPEPWEWNWVGIDNLLCGSGAYTSSDGTFCDDPGDEMFFYSDDGLYRYYDIRVDGTLPSPLHAGTEYSHDWSAVTAVDLDGDGHDEMFFYRNDGLYRYYNISNIGGLSKSITSGDEYTHNWSAITAIDLDGDGQDEMFFYRDDGLYRYYDVSGTGAVGKPIRAGDGYTNGWDAITAVDLDGDGQDEMFFYRDDGLYRYYNIDSDGSIGSPIRAGDDYTHGWSAITAIDLDGDGQDEMFFYRDDGLYRYYNINADGAIGSPIRAGDDYTHGWDSITAVNLAG